MGCHTTHLCHMRRISGNATSMFSCFQFPQTCNNSGPLYRNHQDMHNKAIGIQYESLLTVLLQWQSPQVATHAWGIIPFNAF